MVCDKETESVSEPVDDSVIVALGQNVVLGVLEPDTVPLGVHVPVEVEHREIDGLPE